MPAPFETMYKLLCELPRSEREAPLEYLAWREASVGKTEAREDWEEFSELREEVNDGEDGSSAKDGEVEVIR